MANNNLVITLEANIAKFQANMRTAGSATQQAMAQMQKDAQMMGTAVGLSGAAAATGLALLVKNAIDAADNLRDMSQKTGIAVETLDGMGFAASQAGGSLDSMVAAAGKLNKSIAEAAEGTGDQAKAFKALGISVFDSAGQLKTADVVMAEIADKFSTYKDGPEKVALSIALMGKAGADMIPVLNDGGVSMRENIAYSKQYSGVTSELAAASDNFNDTMGKLHVQQKSLGNSMATALLPIMQQLANEYLTASEQSDHFSLATKIVRTALETVVVMGSEVAYVFKGIGTEIGGIAAQLVALAHGDFKGFSAISDAMRLDAEKAAKEHDAFIARIMDRSAPNANGFASNFTSQYALRSGAVSPKTSAPKIPGTASDAASKKAADEAAKALAFYTSLMDKSSGYTNTYAADQNKLALALKNGAISYDDYATAANKLLLQQPFMVKEVEDATKLAQARGDLRNKENKQIEDWMERQRELFGQASRAVKGYQKDYAAVLTGMGKGDAWRDQQAGIASLQEQFKGQPELLATALQDWNAFLAAKAEAESNWVLGSQEGIQNYLDSIGNMYQSMSSVVGKTFKGMEDAIVSFVKTGKLDFSSLSDSIISDLVRIGVQQNFTVPLAKMLGFSFLANGGAYAGGVQKFANGSAFTNHIVDSPTLFKFANGVGMMGEAGPEAIMPLTRGADGKLGVQASGGAQSVRPIYVTQNFTVGDVASVSMVRQAVAGSERRIAAGIGRSLTYGGALA